jgi:hypothetical protein
MTPEILNSRILLKRKQKKALFPPVGREGIPLLLG